MTAIKESSVSSRGKRADDIMNNSIGGSSVYAARERFAAAVSRGVAELTGRYGYGRERAAELLLGEIRVDDGPPCDSEVFRAMERCRMGMEEAAKTVTVARALRRARCEKGLSAVDAIDDLTSKLSISSLVMKVEAASSSAVTSVVSLGSDDTGNETSASPVNKLTARGEGEIGVGGCSVVSRSKTTAAKTATQRANKCVKSAPARNVSTKTSGRKRPFSGCDDPLTNSTMAGTEMKDEVEADLSTKAKLADKEEKISDTAVDRCKSPTGTMMRTKRGTVHRGEDQLLMQQPALKRPRADSEL